MNEMNERKRKTKKYIYMKDIYKENEMNINKHILKRRKIFLRNFELN